MRAQSLYSFKVRLSGIGERIVLDDESSELKQIKRLLSCKDLGFLCRPVGQITLCGVWFAVGQDVPDSGQEHLANGDNSLFMSPAGFEPAGTAENFV